MFEDISVIENIGSGNNPVYAAIVKGKPMALKSILVRGDD